MQERGCKLLQDYFEHCLKSYSPSVTSQATRCGPQRTFHLFKRRSISSSRQVCPVYLEMGVSGLARLMVPTQLLSTQELDETAILTHYGLTWTTEIDFRRAPRTLCLKQGDRR